MSYKITRQSDGLFTIHDVAIFAACKRGKMDYDNPWLDKAVAIANAEERFSFRPSVFIKHNPVNEASAIFQSEDADGQLANMRRRKVRVNGRLEEGIISDLVNLTEETAEKVKTFRLPGRSIEAVLPAMRNKIDGLALLGRTPPYHALGQGSETELDQFSLLADQESQRITFAAMDDENDMTPPMPGQAAPGAAPQGQPPAADPMKILQQMFALLSPLFGGAAQHPPAAQAAPAQGAQGAAPSGPPMGRMSAENADNVRFTALQEQAALLKAQLETVQAQVAQQSVQATQNAQVQAQKDAEAQVQALFSQLRAENKVFSEPHVRTQVQRFGLNVWKETIYPLLLSAPVGAPPPIVNPVTTQNLEAFGADKDMQQFGALSPELRPIALAAAREYDEAAARSSQFTIDNPRDKFIAAEVAAHRAGQR